MNATVRSMEDARAKRDLLDSYIAVCDLIDEYKAHCDSTVPEALDHFGITIAERLEVFERRRDRLLGELTNKGIRIHAESETLKSLAGVIEQNHANKE